VLKAIWVSPLAPAPPIPLDTLKHLRGRRQAIRGKTTCPEPVLLRPKSSCGELAKCVNDVACAGIHICVRMVEVYLNFLSCSRPSPSHRGRELVRVRQAAKCSKQLDGVALPVPVPPGLVSRSIWAWQRVDRTHLRELVDYIARHGSNLQGLVATVGCHLGRTPWTPITASVANSSVVEGSKLLIHILYCSV
jgi:hypothetical protein